MINHFIKTVALLRPTGKVIPILNVNKPSTLIVLKQLQLKLDDALRQQYTGKIQANADETLNGDKAINSLSRFI